eukprot:4864168-Pyramimonas_sp.AAC.1
MADSKSRSSGCSVPWGGVLSGRASSSLLLLSASASKEFLVGVTPQPGSISALSTCLSALLRFATLLAVATAVASLRYDSAGVGLLPLLS